MSIRKLHKKKKILLVLSALCLCTSLNLFSKATYIHVKAVVAQELIHYSWEKNKQQPSNYHPHKPWPWADISPVAKIQVPRLKKTQYVLNNASGHALAFGAGLMQVGDRQGLGDGEFLDQSAHMFLAGHRDTHFKFLQYLQQGDEIVLENYQGTAKKYTVFATQVMDSRVDKLQQFAAREKILSLVTCFPFDAIDARGPLRYVVHAYEKLEGQNPQLKNIPKNESLPQTLAVNYL